MTPGQYRDWLAVARRHARADLEAEDLLHDALLAAADAGRLDLGAEANRRWLTGVIRNRAAFQARSAVRRRARDGRYAEAGATSRASEDLPLSWDALGLEAVPPSARRVLVLALHGLGRDEVCAVLDVSPAALRQRLVALRRALSRRPALEDEVLAAAGSRRDERASKPVGLMRRALSACDRLASGLGTHDPDGHLIVLRSDI